MFSVTMASQVPSGAITSDRRLCVTADGLTLVETDDPRAAQLLCAAGGEISADRVRALGLSLVDGKVVQRGEDRGEKAMAPPEDKELAKPADKARAPEEKKSGARAKG